MIRLYLEVEASVKKARTISDLNHEQIETLLDNWAKNWLAHDGLWFQAAERHHGIEHAIQLDAEAWERFTVIEAKRIMQLLGIKENGGLDALDEALNFRLYARLNRQKSERPEPDTLIFRMIDCRVQSARRRKGMADFPCKPVGIVEYSGFARTIDSRIETECIECPPENITPDAFCAWKFTLK